jgi:hypothetical protein
MAAPREIELSKTSKLIFDRVTEVKPTRRNREVWRELGLEREFRASPAHRTAEVRRRMPVNIGHFSAAETQWRSDMKTDWRREEPAFTFSTLRGKIRMSHDGRGVTIPAHAAVPVWLVSLGAQGRRSSRTARGGIWSAFGQCRHAPGFLHYALTLTGHRVEISIRQRARPAPKSKLDQA